MELDTGKIQHLANLIDTITEWTGRCIAWLTVAMVLVTFLIVLLRYAFDTGFIWMQESVTWMHALVFMLGAPYTLKHGGHVRVDVFYRRMTPKRAAGIDLAGTFLLLLPSCAFLFWSSMGYVADSWSVGESSREAGGLPGLFILKTAIPVTAVLLAIQGLAEAARSWLRLRTGQRPKTPERAGL